MRKLCVVVHVIASVGWLGAVIGFLVLAIAGLDDANVYGAMSILAKVVIVPLCLAALVTGIVVSLVTPWGLVVHYWVAIKLAITVLSTVILIAHLRAIDRAVVAPTRGLQLQLVVDSAAASLALIVATVLAVVKPRGQLRWRGLLSG